MKSVMHTDAYTLPECVVNIQTNIFVKTGNKECEAHTVPESVVFTREYTYIDIHIIRKRRIQSVIHIDAYTLLKLLECMSEQYACMCIMCVCVVRVYV